MLSAYTYTELYRVAEAYITLYLTIYRIVRPCVFTDRVSQEGKTIDSVRPSVRPSVCTITSEPSAGLSLIHI